jgi:hypothetical protein
MRGPAFLGGKVGLVDRDVPTAARRGDREDHCLADLHLRRPHRRPQALDHLLRLEGPSVSQHRVTGITDFEEAHGP